MITILFVCVHNSGRSQMAEALLNFAAHERGLSVRATSAGTAGGKELNPIARQAMDELDISMSHQSPKLLTDEMVRQADRIVSMGCGVDAEACPARFVLTEDWGLDDPAGQPIETVRAIRDAIAIRVQMLLDELDQ